MTLISVLDLVLKPEAVDDAPAVLRRVLAATRAFDGSLGVEVVVDATDSTHWSVIERWVSMDADDAYRAFRRSAEGRSDLASVLASSPVLTRYTLVDA